MFNYLEVIEKIQKELQWLQMTSDTLELIGFNLFPEVKDSVHGFLFLRNSGSVIIWEK